MSAEQGERCRLCGSPVEVVSSDEGTSYYRPAEQGEQRHAYGGIEHSQPGPFDDCLLCRIEELERRLVAEINRDGVIPFLDATKPMSAEQGDIEIVRRYIFDVAPMEAPTRTLALAALDRLAADVEDAETCRDQWIIKAGDYKAALERAERERADLLAQWSDYKATTEDVIEAVEARAEKAERALGEIAKLYGDIGALSAGPMIARAALASEKASDES